MATSEEYIIMRGMARKEILLFSVHHRRSGISLVRDGWIDCFLKPMEVYGK